MSTRPSFRPRPLDINQKLAIVRDPKEISAEEMAASRAVQHSHMKLDEGNDQLRMAPSVSDARPRARRGFQMHLTPRCTSTPTMHKQM
jgi:hypothetical protein